MKKDVNTKTVQLPKKKKIERLFSQDQYNGTQFGNQKIFYIIFRHTDMLYTKLAFLKEQVWKFLATFEIPTSIDKI